MVEEKNKWIDAITRLTKLTQEGELKWSSEAASPNVLVNDDVQQVETMFTAIHKGKRLRLYKKRFKVEEPPNPLLSALTTITGRRNYPYWTAQIYLELVNDYGHSLWTFPEVSALSDLLTSVKYQVSGVKDFLDALLEEQDVP